MGPRMRIGTGLVAEGKRRGLRVTGRVEPLVQLSLRGATNRRIAASGDVRSRRAAVEVRAEGGRLGQRGDWETRLEGRDAADSPAGDHLVQGSLCTGQIPFPVSKWQRQH